MAAQKKKRGGGNLARTETVTVRLDPRLNYLCELAARSQRRTKSSFVEALIDSAMKEVVLYQRTVRHDEFRTEIQDVTIAEVANDLWSVREHERLIALVIHAPELMTYEEQTIWALIKENPKLWLEYMAPSQQRTNSYLIAESLDYSLIYAVWNQLVEAAEDPKKEQALRDAIELFYFPQ